MGLSLRLGLGLSSPSMGGGVPSWVPRGADNQPALFTLDAANDRGWYRNTAYYSEAAMLAAMNAAGDGGAVASKTGITRTLGNFVAADAPNLLTNGDFSGGDTGWTAANSGLFSVVAGEGVLDGNAGSSPRVYAAIPTTLSKAFRATATYRRGTTVSNPSVSIGAGTGTPAENSLGSATSTSPVTNSNTFGAASANSYINLAIGANPAIGTAVADNFIVKEAGPFAGWNYLGSAGQIEFTTPAAVATAKVLAQLDDNGARHRVRLVLDTDQHLRAVVTFSNVAAASLDLGVVAFSTAYVVEWSTATNRFMARLGANPTVVDTLGSMPGLAYVRVGRSNTGETWDGAISNVSVFADERIATDAFYTDGDSFISGAVPSDGLYARLMASTSRRGFSTAAGGSTVQEQAARVLARPGLCKRGVFIHWDGDHNGWVDLATYMASVSSMMAAQGGRFILIPPLASAADSAPVQAEILAIRDAEVAAFGANVLDWRNFLTMDGTVVATSELQDGVHLTNAAMDKMVAAVDARWTASGW